MTFPAVMVFLVEVLRSIKFCYGFVWSSYHILQRIIRSKLVVFLNGKDSDSVYLHSVPIVIYAMPFRMSIAHDDRLSCTTDLYPQWPRCVTRESVEL
jgi:hypothetical protein